MRLSVLTTGRQDWGILRSTCLLLAETPGVSLQLLAGGMHLSPAHGETVRLLEADGCPPAARLDWMSGGSDGAPGQAGRATAQVGGALARLQPDAILLAGDRFETAAAAIAATLERVPIVHLHGGEETEGAFDNSLRHAITKLAHLHLTSHPDHAARVVAMGEAPEAVHVVGAPGLDNLHRTDLADRAELAAHLELELRAPLVVVTYHPATLGGDPASEAEALVRAMDLVPATYVITLPNTDPGHAPIRERLQEACAARPRWRAVDALGERRFWGLLRLADAVLGNSSSALIEAPVLGLPAVNVGARQQGRLRGENVLDCPADAEAIAGALRRALSPGFRADLPRQSPFGDGRSAARIVQVLRGWTPPRPPLKPGIAIPPARPPEAKP